jgi:TonB family protein
MQERGNTAGEYSHDTGRRIARYAFVYALLVSVLLHLFSVYSVRIYVKPAAINKGASSNISFLGSILEEGPVLAGRVYGKVVSDTGTGRKRSLELSEIMAAGNADITNEDKPVAAADFDMLKEIGAKLASEDITGAKQMPQRPSDIIQVSYKAYPSQIKGPVRFREVVYKPDLPSYLRWDEELGVDLDRLGDSFEMELKFRVSAEGKVESVERISSSGHPTIDLVGIRYLKGWQFAPLTAGGSREEQWGTVTLNFSLRKSGAR